MKKLRRAAFDKFGAMEWPNTSDEEWRRSDISNYDFDSYGYGDTAAAKVPGSSPVPEGYSGWMLFEGTECVELSLSPELAEKGVVFLPLKPLLADLADGVADGAADGAADGPAPIDSAAVEALKALFSRAVGEIDNRVRAWHYASMSHGCYVYVPEFVEIALPFGIAYRESGDSRLSSPQTAVVLEKGARATVVQTVDGEEAGELLFNEGSDADVRDAAKLIYVSSQNLNLDCSAFTNGASHVARDASFEHFSAVFGGMFAKDRYDCTLDGQGADVLLYGVYFGHEDQHLDVRTVQHHNAPNATSRTFYKGAVKDEAHAVYQGLIQVAHEAVRTDAFLDDKNLILNDGARADSIPSLQINTDDVKCSHGSTTGRLDKNQLFYLLARGYDPDEAKELLVEGFFGDIIDKAPEVIREDMRSVMMERLLAVQDNE